MNTAALPPPEADRLLTLHSPSWSDRMLPGGGLVSATTTNDTVQIRLAGEIDVYDRFALDDALTVAALQSDARLVHVVADDVAFIDLRILRLVAHIRGRLQRTGRDLIVTGLRGVYALSWTYVTTEASIDAEQLVPA